MNCIVCDNGTGFVKCGFAGQNFPSHVFPSVVGRPVLRADTTAGKNKVQDINVGDETVNLRHLLSINYPLQGGVIKNWTDAEIIWDYTFKKKLNIDPTNCRILLTEAPSNPRQNRMRMISTMFEKYKFPHVYVAIQGVLVLWAQGLTSGVVLDSGDGVTHIIPVFEGMLAASSARLTLAGRDITSRLIELLQFRGYNFNQSADWEVVRDIKEKHCYIARDHDVEKRLALETTNLLRVYELPDGREVKLGKERFEAPEALFHPDLLGRESDGVHKMLYKKIMDCAVDLRAEFFNHIVLSGGSTMYPGFSTRLGKEIRDLYLQKALKGRKEEMKKFKLTIEDPPTRKNLVFVGGAVLADIMKDRDDFWMKKTDYEEMGKQQFFAKYMPTKNF